MNRKKQYIIYTLLYLLIIGCATRKQLHFKREVTHNIELGVIVQKEGALKNHIEIKGRPSLTQKLEVTITEREFTKTSFARYTAIYDSQKTTINYTDDLEKKPTYLEVELTDDIELASMINADTSVREYVRNSKNAGVVTKIAIVVTAINLAEVTSSYLEATGGNNYVLRLYKGEDVLKTIPFSETLIFEYQTSFFCYGKNEKGQVAVMDIVEEGKSCKRPLVRKAKKLNSIKKLVDY